jgi:hypothetical protein
MAALRDLSPFTAPRENHMANITFPNRPCPKCGKPIHVRTKSHDCGWKAEATAVSKAKLAAKAAPAKKASANGSISKMEAVRRVLASSGKDTMPLEIQDQLKKQFNIKMDATVISTYKSSILKKGTPKKAVKLGRPGGSSVKSAKVSGSGISIEDIQAVKSLAEKIGAEKLKQLAEVLA